MASKSMKPSAPVRREPTEEEKQQALLRAFAQERRTLIQGIAFNLAGNPGFVNEDTTPAQFAAFVLEAVDTLMEKQYAQPEQGPETEK